jgi:hypothetical protein
MQYFEKVVDMPHVLREERPIEVPQRINVELVTRAPRPSYESVPREVPKVQIQPQEQLVEVPQPLHIDNPVAVPQIQKVDLITQVSRPTTEYVDKRVPKFETQAVERVVEVPQVLVEEIPIEVPQVQIAEVIREEAKAVMQEVIKEVPKAVMKYLEKVVEISTVAQQDPNCSVSTLAGVYPTVSSTQMPMGSLRSTPPNVGTAALGASGLASPASNTPSRLSSINMRGGNGSMRGSSPVRQSTTPLRQGSVPSGFPSTTAAPVGFRMQSQPGSGSHPIAAMTPGIGVGMANPLNVTMVAGTGRPSIPMASNFLRG